MWENVGIVGFPQAEECELRLCVIIWQHYSGLVPARYNTLSHTHSHIVNIMAINAETTPRAPSYLQWQ